ncbi:hypothetical protein [Gilvibacter sp.]|uniref:hypothetical protein n=1 Tax=Gilvibacter sp. TaxID=2729997 RepID=UPI0025C2B220|nr:hypothetical protein [Gilvibacter sp.]NQX77633.1 hypothetical protein [Gilvibacter sp.]
MNAKHKLLLTLVVLPLFAAVSAFNEPLNAEEVLENSKESNEKYWFYVRTSFGGFYDQKGFHYSQILLCTQKVSTPGVFSKKNAVGPFNTYADAAAARRDELDTAQASGLELIPRQAVCDTRWD